MSILFAIIISVIGTCLNSIGLLLQKQGVNKYGDYHFAYLRSFKWISGLIFMILGWSLYIFSLSRAPLYIIQPLQGAGLIIFLIFSRFILKERVGLLGVSALIVLIIGIVLIGFGATNQNIQINAGITILILISISTIIFIFILLFFEHKLSKVGDYTYGLGSGLLIGLGAVYTKILTEYFVDRHRFNIIVLILIVAMIIGTNLWGLILLQKGFARGKAVVVVMIQTTMIGLFPTIVGFICFKYSLPAGFKGLIEIAGISFSLIGTALLAPWQAKT